MAFDDLNNETRVKAYFDQYFPDVVALMPSLIQDFFKILLPPWLPLDVIHGIIKIHCY